jgi:cyclohexyl-isocyanide hydratase
MNFGMVTYPGVTALDAVGPFEVLSRLPDARFCWIAGSTGLVTAQNGLRLGVDTDWDNCPPLDVLCVPGGPGLSEALEDIALREFLRRQGETVQWLAGVCTGSLLLGAAGLLQGYRATTHWRYHSCLADLRALPVRKRVVVDRNRITAAGVSAGIDMGLFLAALLNGERTAQTIQLQMEYDPHPPFQCGSPERADPELVEALEEETAVLFEERQALIRRLAAHLP